ncbi:MAG: hypothetical protein EOP14_04030, partial [Pseudomonas sp.]
AMAGTYTDAAGNTSLKVLPTPGAAGSLGANKAIVIDAIPPTVTNITSTLANGAYGPGNIVDIQLTFSKVVNVTGTPRITLNTTPATRTVNYSSGSGTNTLTFNYTIPTGDVQADLGVTLLALNGGTIKDALVNSATLTLPSSGATGSLDLNKNIEIAGNSVVPVISSTPATQNGFTGAAITSVDTNAQGATDLDADGQAVTYTCLYDMTNNSAMDAGGTPCASLPNTAYSFSASTGVLTWTPSAAAVSDMTTPTVYEFQIKGKDTTNLTGTTYFKINLLKSFTSSLGYDAGTSSSYTFDASLIDFSGGYARLQLVDMIDDDNSATGGFAAGSGEGSKWYGVAGNDYTRLDGTTNCDGRTTNCSGQVDRDWAPQYGSVVSHYDFNSTTTGWTSGSYPSVTSAVKKMGTRGLLFNGTSHYLQRARSVQDDFTIMFWIKTAQTTSAGSCANFYDGAALVTNETGGFVNDWGSTLCDGYVIAGTGGPDTNIKSTVRINDSLWHSVAFTRLKSTGVIKLYIDGVLQSTATGGTNSLTSGADMYLGAIGSGATIKYSGYMDEVNMWSSVLDDSEIQLLYDRQLPTYGAYFQSRIIDTAGTSTPFSSLSWTTTKPFGKELPDYVGSVQNEAVASYSGINNVGMMNNIVGLWHLNESAAGAAPGGKDFTDSSGQGNHGTLSGAVTLGTQGRLNKAPTFAGGYIDVGASTSLDFGVNNFSISMWVKTKNPSVRLVSSKLNTTANGVDAYIDPTGFVVFSLGCNGGAAADCVVVQNSLNVADGRWHHIVLENDKTYNVLKIFVDSIVQVLSKVGSSGTCAYLNNGSTEMKYDTCPAQNGDRTSTSFLIGSFTSNFTPYTGVMDEVAIWKKALTNGDILDLYRRGANRLLFQVRGCANAGCPSAAFRGPDNTKKSFFSELNNNTVPATGTGTVKITPPVLNFADYAIGIGSNRYFQYQYFMESDDFPSSQCIYSGGGPCSAELKSVSIGPTTVYPSIAPSIVNNTAIPFYTLASASETASCASGVKYQLSINGSSFFYYNGSAWVASDGTYAQSSTSAQINTGATTVATSLGRTSLYVKALLNSSGTSQCTLDAFGVSGNSAY